MTSPLSPEAVAQMVADREAGTPGPWHFDGPVWNQIVWTGSDNRLCFMAHSNGLNDDRDIANASRIARLPDLEAAYLTIAAENATMREERDAFAKTIDEYGQNPALMARIIMSNVERGCDLSDALEQLATLRASEAAALERVADLEAVLVWYGEQARLCRLIHSEGDAGRHALNNDGGKRAVAAIAQIGAKP